MNAASARMLRTYITLTLASTFASSFIWGINTLFLLDAGLSITEAFAANAFFTAGMVLFELPTGIVADTFGRRASYLLGSATLFVTTLLYLLLWQVSVPFWAWALVSAFLGLGFTFFSGATEAWLVDGMTAAKYGGSLESVFAKGEIAEGIAMLTGTVAGGLVAQYSNLGVPYLMRAAMLLITFVIALIFMHDKGFRRRKRTSFSIAIRSTFAASLEHGLRNPPVRWLMLSAPFAGGVMIYAFYAAQPYLLELWGEKGSYAVAGAAAALVAGSQIVGGLLVPYVGNVFKRRTTILILGSVLGALALALIGIAGSFWAVLALLAVWSLLFAATTPIRQSYLNGLIPSAQRATVLSSDNLLASTGGVLFQPALGKAADIWGYAFSFILSSVVQAAALPLIFLARKQNAKSDSISGSEKAAAKTRG